MTLIDLHVHTNHSPDALIRPKTIVHQLHVHPTIKAAAITDHNTVQGYRQAQKLAKPYPDILVIPGVEISASGGDIIVLGIQELPTQPWTVQNIINFAKENGGITIVAHPYRAFGLGDNARNYVFDAVEVLNGASASWVNKMAVNLARTMGLPGVAGSDAHHPHELWTVYTEVQADLNVQEVLKAIKKGRLKIGFPGRAIPF